MNEVLILFHFNAYLSFLGTLALARSIFQVFESFFEDAELFWYLYVLQKKNISTDI